MENLNLKEALERAEIPMDDSLDPTVLIFNRYANEKLSWVVYFSAASAEAFELPSRVNHEEIMKYVAAIMAWDVMQMEGEPIPGHITNTVREAAQLMFPCPLKELFENSYS